MNHATEFLFVYGSLRSGFRNAAYDYLTQSFTLLGDAIVQGELYDNGHYPVGVPSSEGRMLFGELYHINNPAELDWAFMQLDDYEGLNVEPGERPIYRRDLVIAYKEGMEVPAWVYWYNGSIENMPLIEGGDVLKYLYDKQHKH